MKRSHLLVTALVLAFPVTASAQHGAVRGGHAAGAVRGGQAAHTATADDSPAAAGDETAAADGKGTTGEVSATGQAAAEAWRRETKERNEGATNSADRKQMPPSIWSAKGIRPDIPRAMPRSRQSSATKKPASTGKKELLARERREHAMEEERIARVRRGSVWRRWLRESDLLSE